jgi:hypothetical protein
VSDGPASNEATVVLADGPLVAPVLSRVVGMLAARAHCPIDRLDDALLVADAVAASGSAVALDGRLSVHVAAAPGSLRLDIGPLRPQGAQDLLAGAELPGVGNVLERVADDVRRETVNGTEHVHIRIGFAA